MSLPWRKRLDHRLLRWQARFEGTAFNRAAPWISFATLWVVLLLLALARSRELSEGADLAVAMQTVWLIGEGFRPEASLIGHNYLFDQFALLVYPVAALTKVFPTTVTLLVIQSGALAITVVPIWRLARGIVDLRVGSTVAIVLSYGLYSAVHAMNLAGFHVEVLALPALVAAVVAGMRRQWWRYWVLVAIVLAARADLGLALAGLGALWFVEGRRRLAWATAVVGVSWTALAMLVLQPAVNGGAFPHVDAFAAYGGDDPFSVLWGVVSNPIRFLQEVFSESNFRTGVSLLAPVLFLPVAAPRWLLPTVPLFSLYLVADVPEGTLAEASQWVPVTAFIFVATVFGLAKTGRVMVKKVNVDRRLVGALLFTAFVFFVRDSVASPYEEPWSWGRRDEVDEVRLEVVELIPDDAVVRAAPKFLPMLTERPGLYELVLATEFTEELADDAAQGVNWLVFDRSEVPTWTDLEVRRFNVAFPVALGWVRVYSDQGIEVFTLPAEADRMEMAPIDVAPVGAGES